MTGLAAGIASQFTVLEAGQQPGGMCASYGIDLKTGARQSTTSGSDELYRFEFGGGHWIFGGDSKTLGFLESLAPMRSYVRRSAVFFVERRLYVPYPLQYNLRWLGPTLATRALREMEEALPKTPETIYDWVYGQLGSTLGNLFFSPFHERYTAGLWRSVEPEDFYKSPIDVNLVRQGVLGEVSAAGYNTTFLYPEAGLQVLAQRMSERAHVSFSKRVISIDTNDRCIYLADGTTYGYSCIVATLPLCDLVQMAGLELTQTPDPYSSVLVLNIGAERGPRCPDQHWLYIPDSKSGFFRVGFYSNVSTFFLPKSLRRGDYVSLYVERALLPQNKPNTEELARYTASVIEELQDWGYIGKVDVADTNWVEVAYTWRRPGSQWREDAIAALQGKGILPVGRYALWRFKGIAESVRDGLALGSQLAGSR